MSPRRPIAARAEPVPFSLRTHTREIMLDAAHRVYGREGYAALTMRALANEIGCSAGAIYTYFKDKDAIISALQSRGLRLFAEFVGDVADEDPLRALREFFLRYYEFSKQQPDYFSLLWVDRAAPPMVATHPDLKRVIDQSHALTKRCLDEHAFPSGLAVVTIAHVLWGAVHGPAVLNQLQRRRTPGAEPDQLAAAALTLALAGLRSGVLVAARNRGTSTAQTQPRIARPRRRR
jgi:AcrR family transcriptional regulator